MKEFWDKRYAAQEYAYGKAPNQFLESQLPGLKPGRILFPAEGEGRNAVYAARLGWEVDAFDISAEGKSKADQLAKEFNTSINYRVEPWEIGTFNKPEQYDAVAIIFNHFPRPVCQQYFLEFVKTLKPNGVLIMEVFSDEQLEYQNKYDSGGPKDRSMLFSIEEIEDLLGDFVSFETLQKKEVLLDEGPYHSGPASVIRLSARRR